MRSNVDEMLDAMSGALAARAEHVAADAALKQAQARFATASAALDAAKVVLDKAMGNPQ